MSYIYGVKAYMGPEVVECSLICYYGYIMCIKNKIQMLTNDTGKISHTGHYFFLMEENTINVYMFCYVTILIHTQSSDC